MGADGLLAQAAQDYAAGRIDAAEAGARKVLALVPGHAGARHLAALCRVAQGALEEGAALLAALLAEAPEQDEARLHLAELRARQGRHGEAVALLAAAVRTRPGFLAAYRPLAAAQWEAGARADAVATWRGYVARVPGDADALLALGEALRMTDAPAEAAPVLRQALALLDDRPQAAAPALRQARLGLAEALMALVVDRGPGLPDAAREAARSEAAALGLRLWADRPTDLQTCDRVGVVLHRMGAWREAMACYRAALAADPGVQRLRLNLAMLELLSGDFAQGWRDYEHRRPQLHQLGPFQAVPETPWVAPADLRGRTVRVVLEQGMGDTLQFARYLPLLARRGARVEVAMPIHPALRPLVEQVEGVAAVVEAADSPAEEGRAPALVLPLLSLPLAFGTELGSIPAEVPYLAVPPARQAAWRGRLARQDDGRRRVGVVWWGNPAFTNDRDRSIPLALFRRLLDRPGVAFHVLADRLQEADAQALDGRAVVHEGIADFADTAALVAEMELVIAVDTAVAHLAGALARPLWLLLPHDPDWRWLLGRADSPWYPTARLFRQTARGDWNGVLARVEEAMDARFR